jgi:SAM-dependent methyltransferase
MTLEPSGATTIDYIQANRAWWDAVVPIHEASQGYDRAGFLRGTKPLCPVELAELGPLVAGKSMLHLQCHFGIDTLNWARLGARVTGLDFSAPAIEAARRLSEESGVPGRFVHANVYEAGVALQGEIFDIVYTGIGALIWLPNIRDWAQVVANHLADGGMLYVYEIHPMLHALRYDHPEQRLDVTEPYFEQPRPTTNDEPTTYVDGPQLEVTRNYEWHHGLGEIVTALIEAGLRIDFLREHREVPWQALPWMEPASSEDEPDPSTGARYQADRLWRLPEAQRELVPLMYSLLATKAPR